MYVCLGEHHHRYCMRRVLGVNGWQSFDAPRDSQGHPHFAVVLRAFFRQLPSWPSQLNINMHVDAGLPAFTDPLQKPFYFGLASPGAYQRLGGVGSQDSIPSSAFSNNMVCQATRECSPFFHLRLRSRFEMAGRIIVSRLIFLATCICSRVWILSSKATLAGQITNDVLH